MPREDFNENLVKKLYKTEMCRYWSSGKKCWKMPWCTYAHGSNELRTKPDFKETKLCSFGDICTKKSCTFAHPCIGSASSSSREDAPVKEEVAIEIHEKVKASFQIVMIKRWVEERICGAPTPSPSECSDLDELIATEEEGTRHREQFLRATAGTQRWKKPLNASSDRKILSSARVFL